MKVVVSRVAGSYEITAFADFDMIGAQMELSDFLRLLACVMKDPAIEPKLLKAMNEVVGMMKKQTAKVVV